MRRASPGFTLIELVISSGIMALVLGSAYLCLQAGLRSERLITARADVFQSARVAFSFLAADLRAATPLSEKFEFLGMERALEGMDADNLDFATHHHRPRGPGEADFCEVSYFFDRNRETGRFGLWRRRDPTPDDEPLEGGTREEIVSGLRSLTFEYYDGFRWYDEWGDIDGRGKERAALDLWAGNLTGLPDAVRITLAFADPGDPPAEGARRGEESAGSPLLFQTVVHLELAARARLSAGSGGSGSGTQGSQAGSGGPQGAGGR